MYEGFGGQPGSTWGSTGVPGDGLFGFNPFGPGSTVDCDRQERKNRIEPFLASIK